LFKNKSKLLARHLRISCRASHERKDVVRALMIAS
jgi:hypothetical protein